MKTRVAFVFGILFFVLKFANAQNVSCPVSNAEKVFMEDALNKFVLDSLYTADFSGVDPNGFLAKAHFAYASTLLGQIRFQGANSDPGIRESASLTELCTEAKAFERTCRSDSTEPPDGRFWKEHDLCVQITCEAKGIYRADIHWSVIPQQENSRFAYNATKKQEIIYDPTPSLTWRLNDRIPGRLLVTGELLATGMVKREGSKNLRFTYTGNLTAVTTEEEGLSSFILHMTFPSVSLIPARAELLLHRHSDSSANGTITVGESTMATLTVLPGQPLQIRWIPACQ